MIRQPRQLLLGPKTNMVGIDNGLKDKLALKEKRSSNNIILR